MIVVIADDFTGAAELGGIGLRYKLQVEINTRVNLQSKADLFVIATDTRSMTKDEAERETEEVVRELAKLNPTWIFKKVDSVLRGYVAEELLVIIKKLNHTRALVVPANPALSRTITDGQYFLNGTPLHQSNFANDPEFPVKTSSVVERLNDKGIQVYSQKHNETLKHEGLIVGDAASIDDLKGWTSQINKNMLLAGASGFFTALLDSLIIPDAQANSVKPRAFENPMLIVSGTSFGKSRDAISKLKADEMPVSYMPATVLNTPSPDEADYEQWCNEIIAYLKESGQAIIAVSEDMVDGSKADAKDLRYKIAIVVKMVFDRVDIKELLIEGGSTASAILKQLCLYRFFPVEELATGVIRMQTENKPQLYITLKPGSYAWPQAVQPYSLY
ncbi:four-carbon acid sugar kinase family protein [Mucilaginibacter sp. AW1-3]